MTGVNTVPLLIVYTINDHPLRQMKRAVSVLVFFFAGAAAHAATFLVPSDHDLIASAEAIAVVTAGDAQARWSENGRWIETVTTLHIDEAIKGPVSAGSTIDVTELGGETGGMGYIVAGAPRYPKGERALVFLQHDDRGNWTTKTMALGKFSFANDVAGRPLLVRDSSDIAGWDYSGAAHREPQRHGPQFLQYVREVAAGASEADDDYIVAAPQPLSVRGMRATTNATPTITSYLLQNSDGVGIRWSSFPSPVVFLSHGSQPGATNGGLTAAQRGLGVWTNDGGSNIVYQYGGTTDRSSTGLTGGGADGVNIILFNDPSNEIPGSYRGVNGDVLAIGGALYTLSKHSFNGEQFYTIIEADLVVQDGISGPGLTGNGFDHVLAHEFGHTLGFRHSDEPTPGGTSTTAALMNSSVAFNSDGTGAALQAWDQAAAAAVYGSGSSNGGGGGGSGGGGENGGPNPPPPPNCTAPSITQQPQSSSISAAGPVVLHVGVSGTEPLAYQWYFGAKGNTGSPVQGATTSDISLTVSSTTSFWARSTNACGSIDSDTAVVTVSGCPAVVINSINDDTTIVQGRSLDLAVNASGGNGLKYQWYQGPVGTTTLPLATTPGLTVTPSTTTTYWVAVTNSCGAIAKSDAIVVTVVQCSAPVVVVQPANLSVITGSTATLYAGVKGSTPIRYEWFEGQLGDTSRPVGDNLATLTTKQIMTPTTYWVRVTNPCGESQSVAATVTPVSSCVAPAIIQQPTNTTVPNGANALLTVGVNAVNPTFRWYAGDVLDFSKPVGVNAPSILTPTVSSTSRFWVRVDTPCGSVNSSAVTVTASSSRRRSAAP